VVTPEEHPSSEPSDATGAGTQWPFADAVLLAVSGIAQTAYGIAALAGNATLENDVRQIESTPHVGRLYLSLGAWEVILIVVGGSALVSAPALARRAAHACLVGLAAALLGLGRLPRRLRSAARARARPHRQQALALPLAAA
jgi:hypothetical protein